MGAITATALLWSITVVPAVTSAPIRHPELAPVLRSSESEGRDSGSLAQIPGQARNDERS